MKSKRLETIIGTEFNVGEAEMVQRFQKLRDMRLLPISRGRNAEDISTDMVASGILSIIDSRVGYAGVAVKTLRSLQPVGGAENAFAKAKTFAAALRAILDDSSLLESLLELRISNSEIYKNGYGRGTIIYKASGKEKASYYVCSTALSLFQPGKEKVYDPRELISSMIQETVIFPRILKRIQTELKRDEQFEKMMKPKTLLDNEQIKEVVERAFLPLRCVAEIWDYDFKLRFKVFDDDGKGLVKMPNIVLDDVRDQSCLEDILRQVRSRIEKKISL